MFQYLRKSFTQFGVVQWSVILNWDCTWIEVEKKTKAINFPLERIDETFETMMITEISQSSSHHSWFMLLSSSWEKRMKPMQLFIENRKIYCGNMNYDSHHASSSCVGDDCLSMQLHLFLLCSAFVVDIHKTSPQLFRFVCSKLIQKCFTFLSAAAFDLWFLS